MAFKKTFCPSPWFHMRINNSGTYEYCRWATKDNNTTTNIETTQPLEFFQQGMAKIRQDMLDGVAIPECSECYLVDEHNKVSGRQRQLLKVGIQTAHFESSLASSPFRSAFDYSAIHNGATTTDIQDWQVDLGNYCNSQCVMCNPESSSKIAAEFKSLGLIKTVPPKAWTDDPVLIDRFCQGLAQAKHIQYMHFIGGETLITPGFKRILSALIKYNLAEHITVGFTTNLTVWDDSIVELLGKFKQVNLGLSIETLTATNDYIRYPSRIDCTKQILDQWVQLGQRLGWLIQLRITPTCLSIGELTSVYGYAWDHHISVESCNFLEDPKFLRISVLPQAQRQQIAAALLTWINQRPTDTTKVINTRNPDFAQAQIIQDATSYVNYLQSAADESSLLPELVAYLKLIESKRGNSVLTYLPQYEELFRSAGY